MANRIDEIEGIGPSYSEKLHQVGIDTTDDLLNMCGRREERDELAGKIGIDADTLLKWTNTADLFRIRGIGRQTSQLLEASGIRTTLDLRDQDATALSQKLHEINARKRLSKINPSPRVVQHWIEQAKKLEPKIT
ncbi:MAG: DUF4332 domain-containing protein [bacterium]|nr:DUF4332 domain-containing protein [bacterium]